MIAILLHEVRVIHHVCHHNGKNAVFYTYLSCSATAGFEEVPTVLRNAQECSHAAPCYQEMTQCIAIAA